MDSKAPVAQSASDNMESLLSVFCNVDKVSDVLERMASAVNVDGIFVGYTHLASDAVSDALATSHTDSLAPMKMALKTLLLELPSQGHGIRCDVRFADEAYQLAYVQLEARKQVGGTVLFVSRESLPAMPLLIAVAENLFMGLVVMHYKTQVAMLQNNLRYQVVWSECMEWVKSVEEANETFFKELLMRASVIASAGKSAIYVVPDQGIDSNDGFVADQWHCRGFDKERLAALQAALPEVDLQAPEGIAIHSLADTGNDSLAAFGSVMLVPVRISRNLRAVMVLLCPEREFGILDEIYISQLLSQALVNLERHDLLRALRDTNLKLSEEKKEQLLLIDKLESAQQQLVQSEKMASIGQLAAGVAHEINNPIGYVSSNLTSLSNYVKDLISVLERAEQAAIESSDSNMQQRIQDLLQEFDIDFLKGDVNDLLGESQEGIKRVKHIVQDLKDFSHVDQAEVQLADLHKCIDSTLNIVHNELKYTCRIEKHYGEFPMVECVASQLNQVFMNLFVNAGHAIEKDGCIRITTERMGDDVRIQVADNGKGIQPEHLNRLFEPFFTTKPVGKGTGLGLSISYGIVQKHHGTIEVQSEPGKGTTFTITLPIRQPEKEVQA